MKKRIPALLLAAILLAACAPMAAAQRSISSPDDTFALPESNFGFFQRETRGAALQITGNVLKQLLLGNVEPKTLMDIMARAPLVKEGDALPPLKEQNPEAFINSLFTGGFTSAYVALKETGEPNVYLFVVFYFDTQGEPYWTNIHVKYNAKTGRVYGEGGNGLFWLGYEFEMGQMLVRTDAANSWHRSVGYSILYDIFAPALGCYIGTLRFPFEYNGRDYMVQIWRGIYGWFSNGGEVGIYEKPTGRPVFWDCSDTQLDISMQMYKGGEMLLDYGTQHTWWLGGFRVNSPANLAPARGLGMTGSIAFEDPAMLEAFLASFEKNKDGSITGKADGMTFSFEWGM